MQNLCGVILSAGYGNRLRPITNSMPKPLLPVLGIPLIDVIVRKLLDEGAESIHCNAFHLKEKMLRHAEKLDPPVEVYVEKNLLGTGGGIANMKKGVSRYDNILLHNGDILSNAGYKDAMEHGPPGNVLCNESGEIIEIITGGRKIEPESGQKLLGYSGMAIISREALKYFPEGEKSNLVDIINRAAGDEPGRVIYHNIEETATDLHWIDIGTPHGYLELHRKIILDKATFHPLIKPPALPIHISEGASVDPGAGWTGFLEIQRDARIERDTFLENCIVMSGAIVERGTKAEESIITADGIIEVHERRGRRDDGRDER